MPKKNKNDILEQELGVITKEKPEVKKPNMYAVVLINDDYTPMEFVIYVLQTIFKKSYEEAKKIMLLVHNEGKGICGIYSLDIAETKANQVIEFSRVNQHPLECKVQKQ
ncbi:ATP-dependent Clp protease adapter ClpS [Alphaproteobacteria bacterium]|jgi:ATP-dependent Clp protease adaptor protein ClpS|nr:ATP-dependent Clp protease adapter ClpS [Alphaproteobacteria bacterium]